MNGSTEDRSARRVLIVDDNRDCADALCEALVTSSDWEAQAAYTVVDGLRRVASEHPDAVLVDLDLPPSSGFVLADALQRLLPALGMPALIAVSGNAVLLRAALQDRRFVRAVMKPAEPERLIGWLCELVPARAG